MLIKAEEITLHSNIDDVDVKVRIGRYPATTGAELIGDGAYLVQMTARNDPKFGLVLKEKAIKICEYAEALAPNGEWVSLNSKEMIDLYISDGETLLDLVRKIHDHNTFFLNSTNLLKGSQKFLGKIKEQATKTFQSLSDSLLAKAKRRFKS